MSSVRTGTIITILLLGAPACSSDGKPGKGPGKSEADAAASSMDAGPAGADYGHLDCSTRETVVEGILSAENMLFTSTARLFISGDDGIHELTRSGDAVESKTVTSAVPCRFGGMTESKGIVYANCYDTMDSAVYAARLAAPPDFQPIVALPGVALANGLTADGAGHLFVTSSLGKEILVLTLATDGLSVASQETWLSADDLGLPNGIKAYDGALYWSNVGQIRKTVIGSDGKAGDMTTLVDENSIFDDLFASRDGILAADLPGGAIAAFDLTGAPIGRTAMSLLTTPSSVLPALGRLGFAATDLIVTEKNANRVGVVHACPP